MSRAGGCLQRSAAYHHGAPPSTGRQQQQVAIGTKGMPLSCQRGENGWPWRQISHHAQTLAPLWLSAGGAKLACKAAELAWRKAQQKMMSQAD